MAQQYTTIYWKDGSQMQILPSDLAYYQSQGWATTNPKSSATTTTQAPKTAPTSTTQAPPTQPAQNQTVQAASSPDEFSQTAVFYSAKPGTLFKDAGSGKMWYKNPTGQMVPINDVNQLQALAKAETVIPGSEANNTYNFAGVSGTQAPTQGNQTTQPTTQQTQPTQNVDQYRQSLQTIGIDTSQMSDQQISWLGMMQQYQQVQAANDKNIAPPNLSPQQISAYLDQAKAELGPAYAAELDNAKKDFMTAAANLTGDVNFQSQQQQQAMQDEQKQLADQMAEAGTAYSGLRQEAETKLKSQEQGLVRSQASGYQNQLQQLAGSFQQKYGTAALQGLNVPALNYLGTPLQFQPYNVQMGSAQSAEVQAEIARQSQLEQAQLAQSATAQQTKTLQPLTSL